MHVDPLNSGLDSPTSIEVISMSESMDRDSLMMSSDFVHVDEMSESTNTIDQALYSSQTTEETLGLRSKDENDIVVIEEHSKPMDPKPETTPPTEETSSESKTPETTSLSSIDIPTREEFGK